MRVRIPHWSDMEWEMGTRSGGSIKLTRVVPGPDGEPVTVIVKPHHIVPCDPTARATDPDTSHMAAAAQSPAKVRNEHRAILAVLMDHGPCTDFDLAYKVGAALGKSLKSVSIGVRRGELVKLRLVRNSGTKGISDTGSPSIRWEITNAGRKEVAA